MTLKRLTRLAILTALCVALREAFAGFLNFQPITAIFFVVTVTDGLLDGILLSGLTMLLTGFLLGFGEVVFRQILVFALLCLIWRFYDIWLQKLPKKLSVSLQILGLAVLSFGYGLLLDIGSSFIYKAPLLPYLAAGTIYNISHAVATVLFYPIILGIFRRLPNK